MNVLELLPRPRLLILIVNEGAEAHGVVLRPHRHVGGNHRVDILLKEMQADQRRAYAHQQDRPQRNENPLHHAQCDPQGGGPSALPAPLGLLRLFSSSVLLQSNEYLLYRGHRRRPFQGRQASEPVSSRTSKNCRSSSFSIVSSPVNIENVGYCRKKVPASHGFMDFGQTNSHRRCQLFSFFTNSSLAIAGVSV